MNNKNSRAKIPVSIKLFRLVLRSVGLLSTQLAGRWAYRLWFGTHRFAEPARETQWRQQAEQFTIPHEFGPIAIYSWGYGPTVLLVHGWNGRGTQMGGVAEKLVAAGYRAIAFDAPGHGRTPGNCSTIFRIVDVVNSINKVVGPIKGVVTHSFGAMVIARALREQFDTDRVVCINPATQLSFLKESFYGMLHITPATKQAFEQLLEKNHSADIENVISADLNARKLSVPALIIHDKDDKEVPWQQGEVLAKAWPGARFIQTQGLGHTRGLRDSETIATVVNFISSENPE